MSIILGGFLALSLLVIYVWVIWDAVLTAEKCNAAAVLIEGKRICKDVDTTLGSGAYMLNIIGGLLSALVAAVLGVTKPKDLPGSEYIGANLSGYSQKFAEYLPFIYILVWMACGVLVVIYGLLKYDNLVPPLSAHANAWLGSAVAAVYAYFGINQKNGNHA